MTPSRFALEDDRHGGLLAERASARSSTHTSAADGRSAACLWSMRSTSWINPPGASGQRGCERGYGLVQVLDEDLDRRVADERRTLRTAPGTRPRPGRTRHSARRAGPPRACSGAMSCRRTDRLVHAREAHSRRLVGDAPVDQAHGVRRVAVHEEDVVGLEVAVREATIVRGGEHLGDVAGERDHLIGRQRAASEVRLQRSRRRPAPSRSTAGSSSSHAALVEPRDPTVRDRREGRGLAHHPIDCALLPELVLTQHRRARPHAAGTRARRGTPSPSRRSRAADRCGTPRPVPPSGAPSLLDLQAVRSPAKKPWWCGLGACCVPARPMWRRHVRYRYERMPRCSSRRPLGRATLGKLRAAALPMTSKCVVELVPRHGGGLVPPGQKIGRGGMGTVYEAALRSCLGAPRSR